MNKSLQKFTAYTLNRFVFFPLFALAAILASCSASTGDTDANDRTVIDKPGLSDIVGTWTLSWQLDVVDASDLDDDGNTAESAGIRRIVDTLTVGADGSYTWIQNNEYDMELMSPFADSSATRGTITMTDGRWTKTVTASYDDIDSLTTDASSIPWETSDSTTTSADEIAIIDGMLYQFAYRRVGSGTGLDGTWARVYFSRYEDLSEGTSSEQYTKMELEISGMTMVTNYYSSATGTFGTPASSDSKTITDNGDGTYSIPQYNGPQVFFAADNVLVFTSNGWTKQ